MRTLLVTNGLGYGGAERIVEVLATDLSAQGDPVQVVATTRGGPIAERLVTQGVQVEILHLSSRLDVGLLARLHRVVQRFRPEVVHSHLAVSDLATALVPLAPGVRRISTAHNSGIELDPLKRWLWHQALRRFDRVLAVSPAVAAALPPGLPIQVVEPSLVDPEAPAMARSAARAHLGLDPSRPVVLAIGRLVPVKGFDVLAQAATTLPPGTQVVVIGEGPERPHLEAAGLRLLGAHPNAEGLLAAADVVVSSSRSEGLPQVLLAALAAGRPVVATAVGGTPSLVRSGENGLLVPAEDPRALAQAIARLLADPAEAQALGQAAKDRVRAEGRTRQKMVAAVRAAYSP